MTLISFRLRILIRLQFTHRSAGLTMLHTVRVYIRRVYLFKGARRLFESILIIS